ncbi:MAG: hypothetical protein H0V82_11130 [Candidatus Protochlamydia sp.]|nr:hypothetical protein [Candidatus Protochlamydia sp.]
MNQIPNNKSKIDDLEYIKMAALKNRIISTELQICNRDEKMKTEIEQHIKEAADHVIHYNLGYHALIEEVEKKTIDGFYLTNIGTQIAIGNFHLTSDKMNDYLSNQSVDNLKNFSADVQLIFYQIAINFYEQALNEKSINSFRFLTHINPRVQSFWIGLALALEKNLNFIEAIECFKMAIQLSEPSDFSPYYGLIRCGEAVKEYKVIQQLLEAAINNKAIKEQALAAMQYLKTKK